MIKIPTSRIETITTNAKSIVKLVSTIKVLTMRLPAKEEFTLVSIIALLALYQYTRTTAAIKKSQPICCGETAKISPIK